jgi:hypothetical protein
VRIHVIPKDDGSYKLVAMVQTMNGRKGFSAQAANRNGLRAAAGQLIRQARPDEAQEPS